MFNRNLELIDNLALKRRLNKISLQDSRVGISYCVTPSNDYVLLKDELPADDLHNPREAIAKMLDKNIKNELRTNDIIITFGIGLGYLLDEVFNRYPSKIFIYEPDINILHFVLNNVDISEHLASGRIYITNDLEELISKLSSVYLSKDRVEIAFLPNYAIIKSKELLLLTQKVFDACKSKMIDVNTIVKFSKVWLENTIDNISAINDKEAYLLSDLENRFVGQTALVVGAGPSLKDNIAKIQANRDDYVIFAVNKIAQYLINNNIIPDFIVCLDAQNVGKTLDGIGENVNEINLISDIRADKELMSKDFKKVFFNFSETDFFIKKLLKYNDFMKFYEAGGSASILALTAAVKLGFSKVVLAGVDLAFKNNEIYSYGEVVNRISQNEIIVDYVKKNLVQVKSVNGDLVYTRDDYETFIHHFEVLIKDLNYSEIYNISSFGALISGVKNVSFDDIKTYSHRNLAPLSMISPFKLDVQNFIQEEFYNINNIISMLSKGVFSTDLVSTIIKSVLVYQYMQSDILMVLQRNFDVELAQNFIDNTKVAIKTIVEQLQRNRLI